MFAGGYECLFMYAYINPLMRLFNLKFMCPCVCFLPFSPVFEEPNDLQSLGKALKDNNVGFDAIAFGDPEEDKKELFETVISVAENNGNCNLLYIPPGSSVREALSRFL